MRREICYVDIAMTDAANRPLTLKEATEPVADEPTAEVRAWQDRKVRRAIKAADAGEFATPEEVKTTVRKYVLHG
jgi:predicted transcriptional regulator